MQVSGEKKSDVGKENLAKEQPGRKASKKGRKTASLSRPVRFIWSYTLTLTLDRSFAVS